MSSVTQNSSYVSPKGPWAKLFMVLLGIAILFGSYRIYQHATSFTVGLDYFSEDFQKYWMTLLYIQLPVLFAMGAGIVGWLWHTRDRHLDKLAPAEELRRYFVLLAQILVFAVVAYLTASPFTEADAAWHQVTVRDTDFTPTHIVLFYFGIPLVVAGPIMIMPNLGLNEWGHTFFYAEELFAAPIHWGFVLLGWATFAAGGLVVQILTRVVELTKVVGTSESTEGSQSHAAASVSA